MPCDLEVDTTELRRAAALLRRAAEAFTGHPPFTAPGGLDEHAAGGTAAGRQAHRMITTRTEQAAQAAGSLAATAVRLAHLLDGAAQQFDAAESLCLAGR